MYISTKVFGHELGLSAAFRQWRATHSHCSKLHGYALSFEFSFAARHLDDKNWAVDFGGLKALKEKLVDTFDHRTVVAADDPMLIDFQVLADEGAIDLKVLPNVGCEAFAEYAYNLAVAVIEPVYGDRIKVMYCKVSEHGANSATYAPHENFDKFHPNTEFEKLHALLEAARRANVPGPSLNQWMAAAGFTDADVAKLKTDLQGERSVTHLEVEGELSKEQVAEVAKQWTEAEEPSIRKGTDLTTSGSIGQP